VPGPVAGRTGRRVATPVMNSEFSTRNVQMKGPRSQPGLAEGLMAAHDLSAAGTLRDAPAGRRARG